MRNAFFDEVTDPKTLLIKNKKKSQCSNFRYLSLEGSAVPIILPQSDLLDKKKTDLLLKLKYLYT